VVDGAVEAPPLVQADTNRTRIARIPTDRQRVATTAPPLPERASGTVRACGAAASSIVGDRPDRARP
jgi:hypothetical protein